MIEELRIGLVGCGNMGGALVAGILDRGNARPSQFTVVDVREAALDPLARLGVRTSQETRDAVADQDIVILGVKPQSAPEVLALVGRLLQPSQVLVSIMAGVSTARIEKEMGSPVPVVRVMPQILARLGAAASAVCLGRHADADQARMVCDLFDQVGTTVLVEEAQMDAVTGLSGSGPAYVYTIIEALSDGGVRVGLPRDVALKLAAQTVMGAARMVLESDQHPVVLRDQVTSPGGTTIAGLHALEAKGLRDALISAVQAATERSVELGDD
ncbi:MAG: pyrroline-5-carboxylate reductase [Gemmatimonadetes bacterium]|jgi:pyrroline-5-carboxylate reductase|nr:pyrroline-5-carboxylate reductase [Gemmatimonadota bacterium]